VILGILALARCGDAVSLDARRRAAPAAVSGEYTWPVRAACLAVAFVFLAAGIAKWRHAGLAWASSDTFVHLLRMNHYHQPSDDPVLSWGLILSQYPRLCGVLAGGTMLLEVVYPLALVSRAASALLVPAAIGLLVAIRLLFGPTFEPLAISHVFWVPWQRVGERLRLIRSGT
jgi:hypothetical protein